MKTYFSLLFAFIVIAGPIRALAQPLPDDLDYGRKKFEIWRQYPEQLAKLRQAAQTFASLPAARQQRLDKLDLDLSRESSVVQAGLHDALDRYTEWLAKLPEADRERIRLARDKEARLTIIKELRQNDWLRQQPKATREAIEALPAELRPAALEKARSEDRQRRDAWSIAFFRKPGMERLYSGVTKISPFAAAISLLSRFAASGCAASSSWL